MAAPLEMPELSPEEAALTEQYIDDYIAGKIPRYQNRLRLEDDDWEEQVQSVPLFMNRAPTAEDMEKNPDLAALSAIVHDDGDPLDIATYYKKHGNAEYQAGLANKDKKALKKAVEHYTQGIAANCPDKDLVAALYNNRAAANLALENYRSVITDCEHAKKVDATNIKTYFRAAKALAALSRYADAMTWCDEGLEREPENASLIKTRKEIVSQRAAELKRQRKKERAQKEEMDKLAKLMAELNTRGIKCRAHPDQKEHAEYRGTEVNVLENASERTVRIGEQGELLWPVMLLYPEYDQSDFIAEFADNTCFEDHFDVMFSERVLWDRQGKYRPGNLDVFFEHVDAKGNNWLVKVDSCDTLLKALQHRHYVVTGGIPQFVVLPKDTAYRNLYFSRYKGVQ